MRRPCPKQRPVKVIQRDGTLILQVDPDKPPKKPRAWIAETFTGDDGQRWNAGLWTTEPKIRFPKRIPDLRWMGTVKLSYPPVKAGDILPLFGRIYRVKSLTKDAIAFEELAAKDLPAGAGKPQADSLFFPLRRNRGNYVHYYDGGITNDGCTYLSATSTPRPGYRIEHDPDVPQQVRFDRPVLGPKYSSVFMNSIKKRRFVEACEWKQAASAKFTCHWPVRNTVRADDKGVIGWIELAPEPVKH